MVDLHKIEYNTNFFLDYHVEMTILQSWMFVTFSTPAQRLLTGMSIIFIEVQRKSFADFDSFQIAQPLKERFFGKSLVWEEKIVWAATIVADSRVQNSWEQ